MSRRRMTLAATLTATLVLGALVQVGLADDRIVGTYALTGRQKSGLFGLGPRTNVTLWVGPKDAAGNCRVARTLVFRKDDSSSTLHGLGRYTGGKLVVSFPRVVGLSGALTGSAGGEPFRAEYALDAASGELDGWCESFGHGGTTVRRFKEKGKKVADRPWPAEQPTDGPAPTLPDLPDSPDVRVERPAPGHVALVGQSIPLALVPAGASLEVAGPARREGGALVFTGPGKVLLRATHEGKASAEVSVEAVAPQITEVFVDGGVPIQDARPPHFARALGAPVGTSEPAAILKDQRLDLVVKLQAPKSLTQPATVRLVGASGGASFEAQGPIQDLAAGHPLRVRSRDVLSRAVAVNALDIAWTLDGRDLGRTPLRVYTILAAPVENPMPKYAPAVRPVTLVTKLHLELACTWANGATRNVGDGLCFMIDNRFAHHVHPDDYRGGAPAVPAYADGAAKPVNYADLPGSILEAGRRSPSSGLYYPPLEPTKDYQQYRHYAGNFGWWVLDNPRYTGGRCNQQASLIADIFGTVGVRARVYYIERVGTGKQSGRPMRRYYKSSRSETSWNFHGVCEAELEGGVKWLYDGSGSYPTRINGQTEQLMKVPDGPFVDFWHPWSYEDTGGAVPRSDYPDTWEGVPLQPGEAPL